MKKYFYNLSFNYEIENEEDIASSFNIGYFSSLAQVKKAIEKLKNQPGFCDYPISCFVAKKRVVNFTKNILSKSKLSIYVLSHEYMTDDYSSIWTEFGLFENKHAAIVELDKQKKKKPYCDHIEDFDISRWRVDQDIQWQEGFSHEDD